MAFGRRSKKSTNIEVGAAVEMFGQQWDVWAAVGMFGQQWGCLGSSGDVFAQK